MLGSQINALDSSTTFGTPYLFTNQSSPTHNEPEEAIKPVVSGDENQDEVILKPETLAKIDTVKKSEKSAPSEMGPDGKELTEEEEEEVEKLEDRDREVRRHEQAHFQAAGNYASPPKYEYQTGPDGKRYAVGGSVEIDMSAVNNDPEATLNKARVIKRAALAPEEPSAQDRKVAREADKMAAEAQKQISEKQLANSKERVTNDPVVAADSMSRSIEVDTEERDIQQPSSVQSPTETLEAKAEDVNRGGISQYKTTRLEMSASNVYSRERLATPGKAQLYSPSLQGLDMYA